MNEMTKKETGALSLSDGALDALRNVFGKGANTVATDEEWAMFGGLCRTTGLNPFTREIWLVPYVRKTGDRQTLIMVGIAGLRRIANEHPQYDGIETQVTADPLDKKKPYSGVCKVYRKDRSRPETVELFFSEVNRKTSDYDRWATAPYQQFTKCLEAAALRKAFPIVAGLYIPEEVGYDEKTQLYAGVVKEPPQKKLERKLSEWAGNKAEELEELPQETERVHENQDAGHYEYRLYRGIVSTDKIAQAEAYARKMGAEVWDEDEDEEHVRIVSNVPLPKLVNYLVTAKEG